MATKAFDEALDQTREIEVTTIGRTTGGPVTFPVWFVRRGDSLLLLPLRGSDTGWYRNLVDDLTIQVAIGFLLTGVTSLGVGVLDPGDEGGWRIAFGSLAIGPVVGILAMATLRRRQEAVQLADGRR